MESEEAKNMIADAINLLQNTGAVLLAPDTKLIFEVKGKQSQCPQSLKQIIGLTCIKESNRIRETQQIEEL